MELEADSDLLSDAFIEQANEVLELKPAILNAYKQAAAIVRNDARIVELLDAARRQLIGNDTIGTAGASGIAATTDSYDEVCDRISKNGSAVVRERADEIERLMGSHAGMFSALLAMQLLPWTIRYYRSRQIPLPILIDTMSDLSIWMGHYCNEHGEWGLGNFEWLCNHLSGRLFRLGRLQFAWGQFPYKAVVLRRRGSDNVIALSEAGVSYRSDGLIVGTNGAQPQDDEQWESAFTEDEESYVGHPLSTSGHANRVAVRYPKKDWRVVLHRGMSVLDVHIAEGSKMTHALCRASYHEANQFYDKYFADRSFIAFVCSSWLLDSQFQTILPIESNIVKFQKDFHLVPVKSDERETYWRVFGTATPDLSSANRDTALRRAIIDFAKSGGKLHGGGGFILRDSIPAI